jgi:cytochrome bd-type quinol oxidase subunit 2
MNFSLHRLRPSDWALALAALALFVFLFFFHWYGNSVSGLPSGSHISGATFAATGWQEFTSSRWVWLVTIVLAFGSVLAGAADYKLDGPLQLSAITAGLAAVSCGLIVYRIAHHPSVSASSGSLHISYGVKSGIWLGLLAALGIAAAAYLRSQSGPAPLDSAAGAGGEAFTGLTAPVPDSPPSARPPEGAP